MAKRQPKPENIENIENVKVTESIEEAQSIESNELQENNITSPTPDAPKVINLADVVNSMFKGYGENGTESGKEECNKVISEYLKNEVQEFNCYKDYNIIVLYDDSTLVKGDADNIYNAVTKFKNDKPILLVLYSSGGSAASAYLIGKLCREYSNGKFVASIPRFAKSAATLITCAANEIHMGSLSELGPIDPQINKLPALGLKNSIEHIAELVKTYPESSEMFAKYLQSNLNLINLGHYERVAESAAQYAERLLETHNENLPRNAKEIALELVYKYKDHGFVIDRSEATSIFGEKIIKSNTEEYELGNTIYKALDTLNTLFGYFDYLFYFIGSLETPPTLKKKPKK